MVNRWIPAGIPQVSSLSIVLFGLLLVFTIGAIQPRRPAAQLVNNVDVTTPMPSWDHIFVIVLENKSYEKVIGNPQASYLNSLAQQYGRAKFSYGIRHPSLPNYLALIGGDTFGIATNCTDCTIAQPSLVDLLEASGKSWAAYMESMPSPCFLGDAPPLYRQKHNPFIYFDSIRNDPARCDKIVPFTQFEQDIRANSLPNFVWITPNMCNDAHDCGLKTMDGWLRTWVGAILQSPAWRENGVLFLTFDEGAEPDQSGCCEYAAGGRITTLVISPMGKPGFASDIPYSHYSLLRTIATSWRLPLLGKAACECSHPMSDFFNTP